MRGRSILACGAHRRGHQRPGDSHGVRPRSRRFAQQQRLQDVAALDARCGHGRVEITPLMTVGDVLASGYRFEAIPDGISVRTRGRGESTSSSTTRPARCPSPTDTATPTAANGENDFDNAQVSRLNLNQHSAGVLNGSFVIPSARATSASAPTTWRPRRRDSTGRSSSRTRSRRTTCSARRSPGLRRSATRPSRRPASSSRSTSRPASTPDLRDGPAQPRERRRRSPGTGSRSSSRATTRSRAVR